MTIKVLDHGYVKLIESYGKGEANEPEAAIIEAARQSTQGSFRGWETDEKLLAFMFNNRHSTPFEFCGMTIEVPGRKRESMVLQLARIHYYKHKLDRKTGGRNECSVN